MEMIVPGAWLGLLLVCPSLGPSEARGIRKRTRSIMPDLCIPLLWSHRSRFNVCRAVRSKRDSVVNTHQVRDSATGGYGIACQSSETTHSPPRGK